MRRRLLLAVVVCLAACGGKAVVHGSGKPVHAPLCNLDHGGSCRSPDGDWTAQFGANARPAYAQGPLVFRPGATGRREFVYACDSCSDVAWVRGHLLVTADDYRAVAIDPAARKTTYIGGFSDIYASPDGRWIVGDVFPPPDRPEFAGVVSLATGRCFAVPGSDSVGPNEAPPPSASGFSPDGTVVVVARGDRSVRFRISALHKPCPESVMP